MRIEPSSATSPASPSNPTRPGAEARELLGRLFPTQALEARDVGDCLKALQVRHGILPDGQPTSETLSALRREVEARDRETAANSDVAGSAKPPTNQLGMPEQVRATVLRSRQIDGQLASLATNLRGPAAAHLARVADADRSHETHVLGAALADVNGQRVLRFLQELPPGLPSAIRCTLFEAIGSPRGSGNEGAEGIMGVEQAIIAGAAYQSLSADSRAHFDRLLASVGGQAASTERGLLLKALAARLQPLQRHGAAAQGALREISGFADAIRGHDRVELLRATSVVGLDPAGHSLSQYDMKACTQVTALIVRGEADPVIAWSLTAGVFALGPRANATMGNAEESQRELIGPRYGHGLRGVPVDLIGASANRGYILRPVTGPLDAYARHRIVSLLEQGVDIPLSLGHSPDREGGGHALALTDVREVQGVTSLKLSDPLGGRTHWVALGELHEFDAGGSHYYLRGWMDSTRGTRETTTTGPTGAPVSTRPLVIAP